MSLIFVKMRMTWLSCDGQDKNVTHTVPTNKNWASLLQVAVHAKPLWRPAGISRKSQKAITACTVVQAVVKATSQSNGKGQILTPWGSETLERI